MALCNTKVGFPVFDVAPIDGARFVLAGGGGSAKSGVKNTVAVCHLGPRADKAAPGVDVVTGATVDTGADICTSCAGNGRLVAFAIENELRFAVEENGNELKPQSSFKASDKVSVTRFIASKPDTVALGLENGSIELVECTEDGRSPKQVKTLVGHVKPVCDLHSHMGVLVSAAADDVRVWSEASQECLQILPADLTSGLQVRKARLGAEGLLLFSLQVPASRKGSSYLVVWKRPALDQPFVLRHIANVSPVLATALGVDPLGQFVAVGNADSFVQLFSYATLSPLPRIKERIHSLPLNGLVFASGPVEPTRYLLSTSPDATCAMVRISARGEDDEGGCCSWGVILFLVLLILGAVAALVVSEELRGHLVATAQEIEARLSEIL